MDSFIPSVILVLVLTKTRSIVAAMLAGLFGACLLAAQGNAIDAALGLSESLGRAIGDPESAMLAFLTLLLGATFGVMEHSGQVDTLKYIAGRFIRSNRLALLAVLFSGLLTSFDDYLNMLSRSAILRNWPGNRRFRRFAAVMIIISATAFSLIVPISTSMFFFLIQAHKLGLVQQAGLSDLEFIAQTIGQNFYGWIIILVVAIAGLLPFKPSRTLDRTYILEQDTSRSDKSILQPDHFKNTNVSWSDICMMLFIPLGLTSIALFLIGWTGWESSPVTNDTSIWLHILGALAQGEGTLSLFTSAGLVLTVISSWMLLQRRLSLNELIEGASQGIYDMLPAVMTLILSWAFAIVLVEDLNFADQINRLVDLLNISESFAPLIVFLSITTMGAILGNTWSAIAVGLPFVTGFVATIDANSLMTLVGACAAGACAGETLSPSSDMRVITTSAFQISDVEGLGLQLRLCLLATIITAIGYIFVV
ncbi:MAG: hypothetical protein AAGF93_22810 [Cyanobacteria bacterium P01_H01_bin.105]